MLKAKNLSEPNENQCNEKNIRQFHCETDHELFLDIKPKNSEARWGKGVISL